MDPTTMDPTTTDPTTTDQTTMDLTTNGFIKVRDDPTPPTHIWVNGPKLIVFFYGFPFNKNRFR